MPEVKPMKFPDASTGRTFQDFQAADFVGKSDGGTGVAASTNQDILNSIGAAAFIKSNLVATTDPTVTDDDTLGYEKDSVWINTTTDEVFFCANAATGAAVWRNASNQSMADVPQGNVIGVPVHIGKLDEIFDHMYSAGIADGAVFTNNLDGTVDISSGECFIRAIADGHETLYSAVFTGATSLALTDNATNFIYIDYNAGTPIIAVTLDSTTINITTKIPVGIVVKEGTDLTIFDVGDDSIDPNAKLRQRLFYTDTFQRANGGAVISSPSLLYLACTAGSFWFGLRSVPLPAFNSSGADTFEYYYTSDSGTTWTESDQSSVSNTQYNDITTGLVSLPANDFVNHWVYSIMSTEGDTHYAVVYGQESFNTLADALAEGTPSVVPPSIIGLGVLLGVVTSKQGDPAIQSVRSAFTTTFSASQVTLHDSLGGIAGAGTSHLSPAIAARAELDFFTQAELLGAVGNLTTPLCHIDLQNGISGKWKGNLEFENLTAVDRTYVDRYGVVQYAGTDVPRNGLLEGAAINLRLNSGALAASIGTTVNANAATASDGNLVADELIEDTSTGEHYAQDTSFTPVAGEKYTWFVEVEDTANPRDLYLRIAGGNIAVVVFNPTTGAITSTSGAQYYKSGVIKMVGGIWRVWLTFTADSATSTIARIQLYNAAANYTGNGVSGLYVWGADLKKGLLSSHIPTAGTIVTRQADTLNFLARGNIPNPDNGLTIFMDFTPLADGADYASLRLFGSNDSGGSNYEWRTGTGAYALTPLTGGFVLDILASNIVAGVKGRWAFSLKNVGSNVEWSTSKDGVVKGSGSVAGSITVPDDVFEIGYWSNDSTHADGIYDNIRIMDHATATEVIIG